VPSTIDGAEEAVDGLKKRLGSTGHERNGSNVMIDD